MKRRTNLSKQRGTDYGYKLLASAIVKQAVRDYKKAPNNAYGRATKKNVVRFIKSPWFVFLSNIDPDYMLKTLDYEEEDGTIPQIMAKYGVSQRTAYRIRNGR